MEGRRRNRGRVYEREKREEKEIRWKGERMYGDEGERGMEAVRINMIRGEEDIKGDYRRERGREQVEGRV